MLPSPPDPNDPREARPPQNKHNEVVRLQSEIASEIERDAPHIARMVFGETKDHPDVVGLPNASIDRVYHQKFLAEDREWLQAEARRDPQQFLKVTQRIGVRMPPPEGMAPLPVAPPMAPPVAPPMAAPVPPPPPPMPVAPQLPPQLPAIPAGPVILGPNGQPLPPSGVM